MLQHKNIRLVLIYRFLYRGAYFKSRHFTQAFSPSRKQNTYPTLATMDQLVGVEVNSSMPPRGKARVFEVL
jgi:hypothetical protein